MIYSLVLVLVLSFATVLPVLAQGQPRNSSQWLADLQARRRVESQLQRHEHEQRERLDELQDSVDRLEQQLQRDRPAIGIDGQPCRGYLCTGR